MTVARGTRASSGLPAHRALLERADRTPGAWWAPRLDRAVLGALVLLGLVLRLPNVGRAYWIDEGISVGIASAPVGHVPQLLRLDGSPPAFYLLLHYWIRAFGSAPVSTHLLAIGISLLIVPTAFWAGRSLFGREAGLAAAALAATNPYLVWFGTETRMYCLLVVEALVLCTFVVRAERFRLRRDVVGGCVAAASLLYTHNWGLYVVAVTAAVLLVRAWRHGDAQLLRGTLLAGVGVGVLYAPWLPTLLSQAGATGAPWAVPPGITDLVADPATMLGGTIGLLVVPALVWGLWTTRRVAPLVDRQAAGLLGAIGLGTLVLGWAVSFVDPSWTVRYLGITFGFLVLAAAGLLTAAPRGRAVVLAVCAACTAWLVIGALVPNPNARYAKDNVAAIAAAARSQLRPGDVVVLSQTEQLAVLHYYLPPGLTYITPTGVVTDAQVVDWRYLVARLQAADPCRTVLPTLDALRPGTHVLEVAPLRPIGASGSAWSQAVNAQVVAIGHLLAEQTALVPGPTYRQGTSPKPYAGVTGQLYTRGVGALVCR
jgi:mannosyltransferase